MTAPQRIGSTATACVLLLAAILLSHPVTTAGYIDDWSYLWSARTLAHTGHIVYNGWATAMLGWQLYAGALFSRLFGDSWTSIRASVVVISLVNLALLHRILLRLGCAPWRSALAALAVSLSNVALPQEVSFMSDAPGMTAVLTCLYLCIFAVEAGTARATILWLAAAAGADVLLGTARQIAWLGALVLVPSAAWALRRRRGVLAAGVLLWISAAGFIALAMRWFQRQPYALTERTFFFHSNQLQQVAAAAVGLPIVLVPLLALLVPAPGGWRRSTILASGLGLGFFGAAGLIRGPLLESAIQMALPLPGPLPAWLAGLAIALTAVLLARAAIALRSNVPPPPALTAMTVSPAVLRCLLWPLAAAWTLLVVTRAVLWPRYLMGLLPLLAIAILRSPAGRHSIRIPLLSLALTGIFAVLAVAAVHDSFAELRAETRLEAVYLDAGLPRLQLAAGPNLDSLVQLAASGYTNDRRIRVPEGTYRPRPQLAIPAACGAWYLDLTPVIDPRYAVGPGPDGCLEATDFPTLRYHAWLPPHTRELRILHLRGAPPAAERQSLH